MTQGDPSGRVRVHAPRGALTAAIQRDDWELAALLLLDAFARVLQTLPPGTVDDVLALISEMEAADDAGR